MCTPMNHFPVPASLAHVTDAIKTNGVHIDTELLTALAAGDNRPVERDTYTDTFDGAQAEKRTAAARALLKHRSGVRDGATVLFGGPHGQSRMTHRLHCLRDRLDHRFETVPDALVAPVGSELLAVSLTRSGLIVAAELSGDAALLDYLTGDAFTRIHADVELAGVTRNDVKVAVYSRVSGLPAAIFSRNLGRSVPWEWVESLDSELRRLLPDLFRYLTACGDNREQLLRAAGDLTGRMLAAAYDLLTDLAVPVLIRRSEELLFEVRTDDIEEAVSRLRGYLPARLGVAPVNVDVSTGPRLSVLTTPVAELV